MTAVDLLPRRTFPTTGRRGLVLVLCALTVAGGDWLFALAGVLSRDGDGGVRPVYWSAIGLLYLGPAVGAVLRRRDRSSLLFLAGLLVAGVYVTKLVNSPLGFATTDEFQTLRSLNDLVWTHHLFGSNPMVGTYSRFPGSQIAFVALHDLSGLTLSVSAKVVIGIELLAEAFAIFLLVEWAFESPLLGFLAFLVYATNPSYVYFDTEAAYESFSLPLALTVLLLVAWATRTDTVKQRRVVTALACAIGVVVCVSHHMTSYWLSAVLVLGLLVNLVRRRTRLLVGPRQAPWQPAVVIPVAAGLWYLLVARNQLDNELGPTVRGTVRAVGTVLRGVSPIKRPFSAPSALAAINDPVALRIIGFLAVGVALATLLEGLWQLRFRALRSSEAVVLMVLGLLYPFALALRLTAAGSETAQRSSEFVFLGVAVAASLLGAVVFEGQRFRPEKHRAPPRASVSLVVLCGGLLVLALGGIVIGQPPYDRLPGPFLVNADARSVGPYGLETADWAAHHWAPGSEFTADPTDARLIAAAGRFKPQSGVVGGDDVDYLYLSRAFDSEDRAIIEGDKISYIVVDDRLATVPPAAGAAFSASGPGVRVSAAGTVPDGDLSKFAAVSTLSRVYDDGPIGIYETSLAAEPPKR